MALNANSNQAQKRVEDLENRLDWLDQERRKSSRRLAELEQRLVLQEREIEGREQRIQELEQQVANYSAQLARIPQIDVQLAQFKDDIVHLIEQYDQRRVKSEAETDRLRRVEHEITVREIAGMRKEIAIIPRLQTDLELRQAEEARLAKLIGTQQNKIAALDNKLETREQTLIFLEEKEKQNNRNITDLQAGAPEINKRISSMSQRLEALSSSILRVEANTQTVSKAQIEIRESTKGWMEQIQIGEYERNQKLEKWRHKVS